MNKIYRLVPKNLLKAKVLYPFGKSRFNTYDFHEPRCELCYDILFFAAGMFCGYRIGKDKRY